MMDLAAVQQALGDGHSLPDACLSKLQQFAALVIKWNPSINIVAKSTIGDLWNRHILDSIQLFRCLTPDHKSWLDLGSGGGFPGMVIGILASELRPDLRLGLVESDRRKSVFLMESSRQLGVPTVVHNCRIEDLAPQNACVVSARALAPLSMLCGYAARHVRLGGVCAFLKGASFEAEIEEARKDWQFDLDRAESVTDSRASILFLRGLRHV